MLLKLKYILTFFIINLFIINNLNANSIAKKNILLIHSYHAGMTWIENINKAVNDTLNPALNDIIIYTEYMDTKRHNSKAYYKNLKKMYKTKYKDIKFDLILSSDNNAFDFLVKNRDEIFGNVPVSFSGVNGFDISMLENVDNITGVAEQFSDKETVETILKLHPNIEQIYIINDHLTTGKAWTKDMKKRLKQYTSKVDINYAQNLTLDELRHKINTFDSKTVVLLGVYYADKNNDHITYEQIGSYLVKESKAPVYCLLNFNISNNIIGGKVIGGYSQGEAMSQVALRILKGEDPQEIPVRFSEANEYVFNYQGMQRYSIDQGLLPKNSTIINKSFSLYEEYKLIIVSFITLFVIFSVLLIAAILYFKMKKQAQQAKKDDYIITLIRLAPIIIIPIVTIVIVLVFIYSANQNHQQIQDIERETYIENKKMQSKREVDRYIQIIKGILENKQEIKDISELKKDFISIAQNVKFGKSGYIFINHAKGFMVYHPNKKLIGINYFDGKHEKVREVFEKIENQIKEEGNGFIEYTWINPSSKVQEQKITYVNYLPQFDWYIASGVYLDEIDRFIEQKMQSNRKADEKNINIIILSSVILFIFSLTVSIILSVVIKRSFENYRQSIVKQIEKSELIEQSKKEFEAIFKYAGDGIAIIDLQGNFLKFNDAFIELTQYNEKELFKKNCNDLTAPEHREKNKSAIKEAIEKGHIDNFEKDCIVKDDKRVTVHISMTLLPDKSSILLLLKDTSSLKILEEQSKLASMGEMIGNIAHQWRQPLSIISTGATGMLMQKQYDALSDEQFESTCNTINDHAQYLSKTIDDFKNFIKNDRSFVTFNLKENIDSFLNLVAPSFSRHNIKVILNLDESIQIKGYPNELIQCFMNIYNNSKDALKESKNEKRLVFIDTFKENDKTVIVFQDNAGGVPADIIDRVFEPYFTTKHQTQGTGLGLSMTYNLIVDGMNGAITVSNTSYTFEDEKYTGARFVITL